MIILKDFLFVLVPSLIIAVTAWLYIRFYLKTEKDKLTVKIALKNKGLVIPLRLQAYERVVLLLERMEPTQLIIRNAIIGQTAAQLQHSLTNSIREEFDHNLSQQLYISSEAWTMIKNARETTIASINEAASKLTPDASANELAQLVFESDMQAERTMISKALEFVKNEARQIF